VQHLFASSPVVVLFANVLVACIAVSNSLLTDVCARSGVIVDLVACKNVKFGICRKTVCMKCFRDKGWDWGVATAHVDAFTCCHCAGVCPSNAQCRTYRRTNERRRKACVKRRRIIEVAVAEGSDVDAILKENGFDN
jgi:hypothetical protein